jgi:uncharacterized protein (UPF0264 family)
MTALLVSVRSVEEAEAAIAGGAGLIDVKEPSRGSLGRADDATIADVVQAVAGRCPISAALGELRETPEPIIVPGLSYVKWGLAGCTGRNWQDELLYAAAVLAEKSPSCRGVAVAYADWQPAEAPPPEQVARFAAEHSWSAFLLDTYCKDGSTLLDWLSPSEIAAHARNCRRHGVAVALAGSLVARHFEQLLAAKPTWFAVRGAACRGGGRTQAISAHRVYGLVESLALLNALTL